MHLTLTLPVVVTAAAYYLFSALAGAMLPPEPGRERTRYGYWFRVTQTLAANTHRLAESRFGLPALAAGEASRHAVEEQELHAFAVWVARSFNVRTLIVLLGLIIQGVILYQANTARLASIDERLRLVETTFVPSKVHEARDATMQEHFREIEKEQHSQSEDIREIRSLLLGRPTLPIQRVP